MRFDFDPEKSKKLKANPKRGVGFEEVQALFDGEHIIDRRSERSRAVPRYSVGEQHNVQRDF